MLEFTESKSGLMGRWMTFPSLFFLSRLEISLIYQHVWFLNKLSTERVTSILAQWNKRKNISISQSINRWGQKTHLNISKGLQDQVSHAVSTPRTRETCSMPRPYGRFTGRMARRNKRSLESSEDCWVKMEFGLWGEKSPGWPPWDTAAAILNACTPAGC